jgi:hypothetical protein
LGDHCKLLNEHFLTVDMLGETPQRRRDVLPMIVEKDGPVATNRQLRVISARGASLQGGMVDYDGDWGHPD